MLMVYKTHHNPSYRVICQERCCRDTGRRKCALPSRLAWKPNFSKDIRHAKSRTRYGKLLNATAVACTVVNSIVGLLSVKVLHAVAALHITAIFTVVSTAFIVAVLRSSRLVSCNTSSSLQASA